MSYTAPTGNIVDLPIGGGLTYTPPTGNVVALPLADPTPAPVAVADAYSIALNTARTVAAPGVFTNDTLNSGVLSSHTSPSHGTLTLNTDGSFTYTPTTSYTGADSFTYTLGNVYGFGTATVSLTVYAAPTAIGHSYNAIKNTALTVAAPGVLNGATINAATITAHTSPSHGSITLNSDGSFVYTPTTGYTGADSFTFTLSNYAGSSTATISLTVTALPAAVNDSYSTPQGVTLSVAAPGPLYNDDLEGATAALGASPTHGAVTFNSDGSFVYIPTSGYSGADSFTYVLTNLAGTSTGTVNLTVTALPATIRYVRNLGGRLAWALSSREGSEVRSGWLMPARKAAEIRVAFDQADREAHEITSPWSTTPRKPASIRAPWAFAEREAAEIEVPWSTVPRKPREVAIAYTVQPRKQTEVGITLRAPPRRVRSSALRYSMQPRKQVEPEIPWRAPPRVVRRPWIPWGVAKRAPYEPGSPGVDTPPIIVPPPVYIPPNGAHVDLPLTCLWSFEAGNTIALPIGPFACYAASIFRKRYIVLNSAAVVRLPERTPISVASGTISSSVDDLYYSFSLTLANPAHLSYLLPDSDGNKLVEININGYVFVALIETYQQQRKYPTRSVTVTGRSQTVVLDDPIAPQKSYVQASDLNAQQLVDNELEFTGFTADYTGATDWLVPSGTYAYDALTPMQSIKQIAAASGAVVQSHPWDKVVMIRPRYPISPWNWTVSSPDKTIQDDIIDNDSLQPATKPKYNYVLVSGQQTGVSDPIERAGEGGDIRKQQVVDSLIVTHPVALERGRNELSDRGSQAQITPMIPLGVVTDSTLPGLITNLQLCQVVEATPWHGLCTATRIEFQNVQASNGAWTLIVNQYVTLERHYDDAD